MAHGYWNFLFKQAEDKDAFLGLSKLVEPLLYLFPFLYVLGRYRLDLSALHFVGVGDQTWIDQRQEHHVLRNSSSNTIKKMLMYHSEWLDDHLRISI